MTLACPMTHKALSSNEQESTRLHVSTIIAIVFMLALFITLITLFCCYKQVTRILCGPRLPRPPLRPMNLGSILHLPQSPVFHGAPPAPRYTTEPGVSEERLSFSPISSTTPSDPQSPAGGTQLERQSNSTQQSIEHFAVDVLPPAPAYYLSGRL